MIKEFAWRGHTQQKLFAQQFEASEFRRLLGYRKKMYLAVLWICEFLMLNRKMAFIYMGDFKIVKEGTKGLIHTFFHANCKVELNINK